MRKLMFAFTAVTAVALSSPIADACTRILYNGSGAYFVGRSMDWMAKTGTGLWAFPCGMKRDGGVGEGSVPLGIQDTKYPDIATTRWRIAADLKASRCFFDSVHTPSVFWVDLDKLGLKPGSAALKLDLQDGMMLSGEVSKAFSPAEPFKFLAPGS